MVTLVWPLSDISLKLFGCNVGMVFHVLVPLFFIRCMNSLLLGLFGSTNVGFWMSTLLKFSSDVMNGVFFVM